MGKSNAAIAEVEQEELPQAEGPKMRKRLLGLSPDAKVTVIFEGNPKRAGSQAHEDWKVYADANVTTVQEGYDAGLSKAHFAYDHIHGFIEVEGCTIDEYEVTPRGPKAETEEVAEPEGDDGDGF